MATLVRLLLAREKADVDGKKRWDIQLSELEDVAVQLKTVSNLIDAIMTAATPQLQTELTNIADAFRTDLMNVQLNARLENSRTLHQISSELQSVSQHHAHSLDNLVPLLKQSLTNNLNAVLSPFRAQSLQALDLANSAQEGWMNLTLQFNAMQQKISQLSGSVSNTATTLEASAAQAQVAHDAQISASLSASHLADTLSQLTTTTQDSLEKLNASAVQLAQSLSPRGGLLDLVRLIEVVLPVDPSIIAYLHRLPVFPVISVALSFLLYLLRSSFSALMSIALLFFSSRKYIIKPGYDQDAAVAKAFHAVPTHLPPRSTRIHRDPETISRPGIRKSRIPDRLCNVNRSSH
ncbi:hypothetical protein C8R47DRAFT_1211846 [Mycena vitilis]|nr:hypothetical protein C8R47DRAFT_1211846 [Mycena vitilis]